MKSDVYLKGSVKTVLKQLKGREVIFNCDYIAEYIPKAMQSVNIQGNFLQGPMFN